MKRARNGSVSVVAAALVIALLVVSCRRAPQELLDNTTLTTRVKTVLLNDPEIGARGIDVDAINGVVTLSGSVASGVEEIKAIQLARRTAGVKDVKSTLQITSP